MPAKEWPPLKPVVETPEGIGHTLPEGPVGFARDIPTYMPDPEPTLAPDDPQAAALRTIETINTPDNRIDLGRSDDLRTYFIRFRANPNDGHPDDRHPAIELVKAAGWRFKPLPGHGMAWQKPYVGGAFSIKDEMDARQLARNAAKLLGQQIVQGTML